MLAFLFCIIANLLWAQKPREVMADAEKRSFITKDVIYKETETSDLHLKLLHPSKAGSKKPVIIFFFGGGWRVGSPKQFEHHAKYFAQRGIIAVLADYRTKSKDQTTPFDAVRDAKSAIRYLRKNAEDLNIDPQHIVASGGSAGGHLAAAADLTALDEADEDLSISSRPNALVLFNPVYDNGPDGAGYGRIGDRYPEISPLHNIRKGAAPTIVFLGTQDKWLPVKTAKEYKDKMEAVGSRSELFIYEGQKHGFFNYRSNRDNKYFFETIAEADSFLVSLGYLKPLN